jgi:hypothetical protein
MKSWVYKYRVTEEQLASRPKNDRFCDNSNTLEWAQLMIAENGMFAATSDYGSYVYHWKWSDSFEGQTFREFLTGVGQHYLMDKVARRDWQDVEETAKRAKEKVLELRTLNQDRYHGKWDKDKARQEWERITVCLEQDNDVQEWVRVSQLREPWDYISYGYHPSVRAFARLCWPILRDMIKQELAGEKYLQDTRSET